MGKDLDRDRCPPLLANALAVHISFNAAIMQYALENWPSTDEYYRRQNKKVAFYYPDSRYRGLEL